MDYEKEYKEALERAKRLRESKYQTMNAKRVAEEIFPQLAGSEDERIRKWIYNMVENLGYPADEAAEKELEEMQPLALAYLEKQKEQKPAEWSDNDDQLIGFIFDLFNDLVWRKDWAMSKEECLERLKSLRPPLKDKEMNLKILKYLSTRCSSREFEEVENYLNNLRPSWKPSAEQMEQLYYASTPGLVFDWNILKGLFEQLKKLGLKEEPEYYQHFDPDC